jgi:hypothetical protein
MIQKENSMTPPLRPAGMLVAALLLAPAGVAAHTNFSVPVVTQVQGVTFYRTSITVGNAHFSSPTSVRMVLSYRSPVDGSFQTTTFSPGPLGPMSTIFLEDVIQAFKDAGAIRSEDADALLFGTLSVELDEIEERFEAAVVARTYSPGAAGGTEGIAYSGRNPDGLGSTRVRTLARSGSFGSDGSTRANIGFVNESPVATDLTITYVDGDTASIVREFALSSVIGRLLAPREVVQLNNVFAGLPAETQKILVEAEVTAPGASVSGYAVQLDNTTNDGSFFVMEEE